jgi:dihydroxyacetone kinase-like protein
MTDALNLKPVIAAAVATIRANAGHLTELDQAIGDGDHGINMKRGFDAVADIDEELAALDPGAALQKLGMTLVMKVGGASGPLYGSFFMSFGKALAANPTPADIAHALSEGIAAVKKRGKSDVGAKTMLDVLVPVSDRLRSALAQGSTRSELLRTLRETAESSLRATAPMQATKGRASFLGERSIGHLDPGAMSSCLLIKAVCGCFQEND